MKALLICSYKKMLAENAAPFVVEQRNALQRCGVECDLFLVNGKGFHGYLKQLGPIKKRIKSFQPDVIHAHYGLCGLLANMQRKVPVVTTYHGSDINDKNMRRLSKIAVLMSAWNIFVSRQTMNVVRPGKHCSLLPCGVDLSDLQLTPRAEARRRMCLDSEKRYILFSGAFDNAVKNAPLALKSVKALGVDDVELLELKGRTREEVTLLMCAADALLMTSLNEGSPQVIKEALACGCPIVSVEVGDVKERVEGVDGCFVAQTRKPEELAGLLGKALAYEGKTKGRDKIIADGLDNEHVAKKIMEIYGNTSIC